MKHTASFGMFANVNCLVVNVTSKEMTSQVGFAKASAEGLHRRLCAPKYNWSAATSVLRR